VIITGTTLSSLIAPLVPAPIPRRPPGRDCFQLLHGGRSRIATTWEGAGGIAGFFERLFAPRAMRGIYVDELDRLNSYARERATT
jgi:hypothetical protein